jgi:hypothetical protein
MISDLVLTKANRYATIAPQHLLSTSTSARSGSLAEIPKGIAKYPLGAGLGSVGPASGSGIGGTVTRHFNGETEPNFLLVETGVPGLIAMLLFTLATIRIGLILRRVADPDLQRGLMALTAVLISLLVGWIIAPTTADSPSSPFIWLTAGCLAFWYAELRSGRLRLRSRRVLDRLAHA